MNVPVYKAGVYILISHTLFTRSTGIFNVSDFQKVTQHVNILHVRNATQHFDFLMMVEPRISRVLARI